MNLKATAFDWLVVRDLEARLMGKGTINGAGCYAFLLTAVDGHKKTDRMRLQIWNSATGAVIFDNQRGAAADALPQELGGGNITIRPSRAQTHLL